MVQHVYFPLYFRLLHRRIGRSEKHHRLHVRHKSSGPSLSQVDYTKPEGRKYSSRVEHSFYSHQGTSDPLHHHTGHEFHGPFGDQAKEVPPIEEENEEHKAAIKAFDTDFQIKNRREKEIKQFEEDFNDRNDISSELEHPMLIVHRSEKPEIEAHQVTLIKPKHHSNDHAFKIRSNTTHLLSEEGRSTQHINSKVRDEDEDEEREMYERTMLNRHHEQRSDPRKIHHYLSGDGASIQDINAGDLGHRDEEREKDVTAMLNTYHEQRLSSYRYPDHVSKPRIWIDRQE